MRALLLALTARMPEARLRSIPCREADSGTYLDRWYLLHDKPEDDPRLPGQSDDDNGTEHPWDLYLHRFHRSDDDLALHNHPWRWALSLVLVGGYSEERRVGDRVVRRTVRPWSFNVVRGDDYHRVDLLEQDAWSLFLVGPKVSSWYFWDRTLRARTHWRAFIAAKRRGTEPAWTLDERESVS